MPNTAKPSYATGLWSPSEHERFLEAIAMFPHGPWTRITEHVGTRTSKQVQTHAQKYQHKLQRHRRGLLKSKSRSSRVEHRVDKATAEHLTSGYIVRPTVRINNLDPTPTTFGESLQAPLSSTAHREPITADTQSRGVTHESQVLVSPHHPRTGDFKTYSYCGSPTGLGYAQEIDPMPFYGLAPTPREADEGEPWDYLKLLLVSGALTV